PKIEVIWNKHVVEIKGTGQGVDHLLLADTITGEHARLRVGGVFIFIGFKPNTGVIEGHVKHDAAGYLITDEKMMTSLPGLFAAGDVRSQVTRQITAAPVYLHPADRELYDHAVQQGLAFGVAVDPPPPPDRPLAAGDTVQVGELRFTVRHAPGHSPGSVCLVGEGVVFTGDVLFAGS